MSFSASQPLFRLTLLSFLTLLSSASHQVSAWRGYHYPDIGPLSQVERLKNTYPQSDSSSVCNVGSKDRNCLTLILEEPIRVRINHEVGYVELV